MAYVSNLSSLMVRQCN